MNALRFQILSDLHLESRNTLLEFPKEANNLILCGDICPVSNRLMIPFLTFVSARYYNVFYIPGNHEFYYSEINESERVLQSTLLNYPNIYYMNNRTLFIDHQEHVSTTHTADSIAIIGSVLWSAPQDNVWKYINDKCIRVGSRAMNTNDIRDRHFIAREYIDSALTDLPSGARAVVVTHFPPTNIEAQDPAYQNSALNSYFVNDIDYFFYKHEHIIYWVFGHTHWRSTCLINKSTLITHAAGYDGELEENYSCVIEL